MTGPHYGQPPAGHSGPVEGLPYQGSYPPVGIPSGPYPLAHSGPQPYPAAGQSGPQAVTQQQEWTYGLPPGVRPDLLKSPLGQHGAMAGTAWEQRGHRKTAFIRLVIVELRKLAGTMSDRLLLALAPLALVGVTLYAATMVNADYGTTAALQVTGLTLAAHFGQIPLYTAVLKTFSGEWHYRSIQLSLLLQPNRRRYATAQLAAVLLLWLVAAAVQFAIFYPVRSATTQNAGNFQDFIGPRPLWVVGVSLLASLLSLLFVLAVTFLISNPTAGVTAYLILAGLYYFRYDTSHPKLIDYVDPWQPATLLAGKTLDPWPAVTSGALLLTAVGIGLFLLGRRDAR